MPNGKGSLECSYCVNYRGNWQGYDAAYERGVCTFHDAELPDTTAEWLHRICAAFSPNEFYFKDNPVFELEGSSKRITVEERFSWFERHLEQNVLYGFHYNDPGSANEILEFDPERTRQ